MVLQCAWVWLCLQDEYIFQSQQTYADLTASLLPIQSSLNECTILSSGIV